MVQFFHDFNLSLDPFSSIGLKQLKFLIDFGSYLLSTFIMDANSYHSISSLSDSFTNFIMSKVFLTATLRAKLLINIDFINFIFNVI